MGKKTIIAVVVVILIGALAAVKITTRKPAASQKRPSGTLVRISLPQRQSVSSSVSLTGDINPVYESSIYSRVTGNLELVQANIGDHVRENQLLALIDTTELYQTFEQAQASYDNAKITYDRTDSLAQKGFTSQADLDNADAALKVAQANYDAAKTHLEYAHIIAPFNGYVTRRYLDPGALVNANTTNLFTLVDIDTMKVFANILERYIPFVSLGTRARISVDAYPDTEFAGAVSRVSGALDTTTRTMAVEIDIPNGGHLLKPGMFGHLTLVLQQHPDAIVVPTYSILNDTTGNYLFIVTGGMAHRRNIQAGVQQDSVTEVVSGVESADSIVTAGQQLLKDGSPVMVQGAG